MDMKYLLENIFVIMKFHKIDTWLISLGLRGTGVADGGKKLSM
jgi:hypothetical protein